MYVKRNRDFSSRVRDISLLETLQIENIFVLLQTKFKQSDYYK